MIETGFKKILISDDHSITRRGLTLCCQDVFEECQILECDSMECTFEKLRSGIKIDLLILDVYFGDVSSIHQIGVIKDIYPNLKVLIVSMGEDEIYGVRAMREGADGYVNKMSSEDEIKQAITTVILGGLYLTPKLQKISASLFNRKVNQITENPFEVLSAREFQVCLYLIKGLDVYEISDKINISSSTVSTYKSRIMTKLECKKLHDLKKMATQYNIKEI